MFKIIRQRLDKYRQDRPGGFLVREAPAEEVKKLKELLGHLQEGQFVTKFRKVFSKPEMTDDLKIVVARWGDAEDRSEYFGRHGSQGGKSPRGIAAPVFPLRSVLGMLRTAPASDDPSPHRYEQCDES